MLRQLSLPLVQTTCFFCQSHINPPPRDPRNFKCPYCQCWNRYDAHGEITSDEPAMHEPGMNTKSFAKRASPRKDRFLPSYGKTVFCHTCQTNQMLLTNLLANYLPSPEDPEYPARLASLPSYQASVELRYPPVCPNCLPVVEEEIRSRDHMARTSALGHWLKSSKGKGKQRVASGGMHAVGKGSSQETGVMGVKKAKRDGEIWMVRGGIWIGTLGLSIGVDSAGSIFGWRIPVDSIWACKAIPSLMVASCFVVLTWNPWENYVKKANVQGRGIKMKGETTYISWQIIVWCSRILTCSAVYLAGTDPLKDYLALRHADLKPEPIPGWSTSRLYFSASLMLELFVLIISFVTLGVVRPPSIRLIEPTTISSATRSSSLPPGPTPRLPILQQPQVQESDLFGSLTLTHNPLATIRTNPIFGSPSLQNPPPPAEEKGGVEDPDAMDWTPTNPSPKKERMNPFLRAGSAPVRPQHGEGEEELVLRRQKFFPPEEPTGLEGLLSKTVLIEPPPTLSSSNGTDTKGAGGWWRRRFLSTNSS
ncbi:hypothetical protein BDM02DRAFT_3090013 [Thelephora ganbajun]|uniref:Uncharacterized protein n=1 Tax=Thelephora ganbajun TaxID=370292 RepID=A0ACB6ZRQ5_THEGA|nr:hypothetical protein BDM02DRAFT_3090013 [Thelephora ganbajun]